MTPLPHPTPNPPARDDTLGRGMEFALVTLVFLGLGLGVDALADTRPVFAIVFVVMSFVGQFVKMHYTYSATMERLEAERRTALAEAPRATVAPAPAPEAPSLPTGVLLDESRP